MADETPHSASESDDPVSGVEPFDPDCELCRADRFTHWYFEDEVCWIADCEACGVPMVVAHAHGPEPVEQVIVHAEQRLTDVANLRFGEGGFTIDRTMRQVPDHFHAHARDPQWWELRMRRPLSRYTSVGGERVEI